MSTISIETKRLVDRRVMSLLFVGQFISFIDRICIGFAALQMNAELGISPELFGLGISVFFVGYALLEVPSMALMRRFGPVRWLSRIMFTWGLATCAMVFVSGPVSFLLLRFLLGVAEAGWAPGATYYLQSWYTAEQRALTIGTWLSGSVAAIVLAGPISTMLMHIDAFNLHGWQWLFLLEGVPAVLLAVIYALVLPSGPGVARWLPQANLQWLEKTLSAEEAELGEERKEGFMEALVSPQVWSYAVAYFLINVGGYSLIFWTPQLSKSIFVGLSNLQIGFISSAPWVLAVVAMLIFVRHSDRTGERRWHLVTFALVASVLLLAATQLANPTGSFMLITLAIASYWCFMTTFWAVPMTNLKSSAAASGFGLINSGGNVAGFIGPFVVGYLRAKTGSFNHGIMFFSVFFILAALVPLVFYRHFPRQNPMVQFDGSAPSV